MSTLTPEQYFDLEYCFYNTPLIVANMLQYIIKDKIVCDVGCREGDFMKALGQYAKEVKGIEWNTDSYLIARDKNLNVVLGDAKKEHIPRADVYYVWVPVSQTVKILKRIKQSIIILGGDYEKYPYPCDIKDILEYLKHHHHITIAVPDQKTIGGYKRDFIFRIIEQL